MNVLLEWEYDNATADRTEGIHDWGHDCVPMADLTDVRKIVPCGEGEVCEHCKRPAIEALILLNGCETPTCESGVRFVRWQAAKFPEIITLEK